MTSFDQYLNQVLQGHVFTEEDMAACIDALMDGTPTPDQAASFLTALHRRGETAAEIAGAAKAMRARASTIGAPDTAIDCCGTGGDGLNTYNISTAVALVAAGCGVKIAKHGNRSASSKSGAADVLEKLGVTVNLPRSKLESALQDIGFCFLMAPNHHAAMKNVAQVRKSLAHRTIFNLLGPLANPANTKKQLIGVYDRNWLLPMAQALQSLGTKKAMVVHGEDGLDEISLTGKTFAAILENGAITQTAFLPGDFGLASIDLNDIKGGDADHNADALMNLLNGAHNAYRSMVLANTAAVLYLHDGRDFYKGVHDAADCLDQGRALTVLNRYKEIRA